MSGVMDALLVQMNDDPTYPATESTSRGSGSYTTGSQHRVRNGSGYGKGAEDQIGAKDVMNVCQHFWFSVNYA